MAELVDDDSFRSLEGKSKHQLWLELCDLITKHPKEVEGLKVDAILRSGIRKFTDEVPSPIHGYVWTPVSQCGVL
jgi:pre-mRNA-splicing factor SYF1